MQSKTTLNNIQLLRAIAALLVILHHASPHYRAMGETLVAIEMVSYWGFAGVDIFFIISGFIMAYTAFNKERTLNNAKIFFKHRLFRIYLGYWSFFIFAWLLIWFTNPAKLPSLDFIGSFFLTNTDMVELILPISWSLSYELYFYFLFLFTFLFSFNQLLKLIPTIFIILIAIVLLSHFSIISTNFFYSPFLLEFFAGVLLFQYKEYLMKSWILLFSIIVVVIAYGYGVHYDAKNGLYRVLTFGTGALFLTLAMLILEQKRIYSANRYFIALGDASYTLYLSHLIFINLFYFTGGRAIFTQSGIVTPLLGLLTILVTSIIFSLLYYKYIEKPLYRKAISY